MNVQCVNDDEDFPVFKAGPPLPMRTKTRSQYKTNNIPLKAILTTQNGVASKSTGLVNLSTQHTAESKVKQYIERVKASDELGRKKRVKPEQMLSLEDLYEVSVPSSNNQFKVENSPEDVSLNDINDKLRETLRIVKEKDELINKLRESCHDLAIKCADAENRVDELRFSYGRSASLTCIKPSDQRESQCGDKCRCEDVATGLILRRCVSAEGMQNCGIEENLKDGEEKTVEKGVGIYEGEMLDKTTETMKGMNVKHDVHTQIESHLFCQDHDDDMHDASDAAHEVGEWQSEDRILQETCSNWLEKIQNWKTDSNFNLSQDSCGDKDSGFRGSAEIDMDSVRKLRQSSITKSKKQCHHLGSTKMLKVSQRNTQVTQIPLLSSSTTITEQGPSNANHNDHITNQHFWPSFSSSQSNFHANNSLESLPNSSTKAKSLFYELAEAKRNKCSYFHTDFSTSHRHLTGTKSLDLFHMPPRSQSTDELKSLLDSSLDPPEFILKSHLKSQHRSIDKKVKMLEPLLDDTTKIALRVKRKSERLAKMLQDACTFE